MEEKSTEKRRNNFSAQEKVAILKKHLLDKIPVSDLCDQYNIQASQFYSWQKIFFENGGAAFDAVKNNKQKHGETQDRQITFLKDKIQRKDEVLAELMEEHIKLKKNLGEI